MRPFSQRVGHDEPLLRGPAGEQILAITSVIAAVQMVWGLLAPILPAFAHSLGVGSGEIGLLVAGFGAGRVAVNIPVGILGRRVNRYWLFLGGAAVVVVASAASGFATTFWELLVLRIVGGMAGGVAITTGQSLLADSTTDGTRARAMSVLQGFQLAGGSIGPALGAFVASTWGLNAPFFVSGVCCFGLVLWLLLRGSLRRGLSEVHRSGTTARVESQPLGRSFVIVCMVGFATFYSRFGIQQTLVPLIAYQVVGLTVAQLGFALSGIAILNIACALFLAGLSDRVGRKRVIVTSLGGVAAATLAYLFHTGVVGFLLVLACYGVFSSIGGGTPAAYVADIARGSRRGPAIGIYRTCGDVAGIVGPIIVGYAVEFDFAVAVVVSVAVNAIAAAAFALLAHETVPLPRRRKPVVEPEVRVPQPG